MNTTLYYFSGSGNSLYNARRIAAELGDTEVVSIPKALREERAPAGGRIGFVFPTYAYGLPRMVREFAERVELPEAGYLFAVASCFGIPGPVLRQLDRLLRKKGRRLDAGFVVADPRSSLIQDPDNDALQRFMIRINRGKRPEASRDRLKEIAAAAAAEKRLPLESGNRLTNTVGGLMNLVAVGRFREMAVNFHAGDACSGCGTCARVCPRGNISIEEGGPVWGDDCEMCHACLHWCSRQAVEYGEVSRGKPRYRNPEVAVEDMLLH